MAWPQPSTSDAQYAPPVGTVLTETPHFVADPNQLALPSGTQLGEFVILGLIGRSDLGHVYLAVDQVLQRRVAIKEYLPAALARRNHEGIVTAIPSAAPQAFASGLDAFSNEGRLLARFDHLSLVKVFDLWRANGTAYMAMPYYVGSTLREARAAMTAPPSEAWLRRFLERLLSALHVLHLEGVFHPELDPDNILLLPDGHPVVLGFGSARHAVDAGARPQGSTPVASHASADHYADESGRRNGPCSDLYALGGVVYFMLSGEDPPAASARREQDPYAPVVQARAAHNVSRTFFDALDWMLAVSPQDRPQSVAVLRKALRGEAAPLRPSRAHTTPAAQPSSFFIDEKRSSGLNGGSPTRPHTPAQRAALFAGLAFAVIVSATALVWGPLRQSTDVERAAPQLVPDRAGGDAPAPPRLEPADMPATTPPAETAVVAAPTSIEQRKPRVVKRLQADPLSSAALPKVEPSPPPRSTKPVTVMPPAREALCTDLTLIARALCLRRACAKPEMQSHSQCSDIAHNDQQRLERMQR